MAKKKGTGKRIGKQWERDVANMFTDVFGLSFQRVPGSGAFIGGKNVERIAHLSVEQILLAKGDIIPPTELPNLIIECKKRKTFSMFKLFSSHAELNKWIDQTEIDYDACGKVGTWFLIMKFNNQGYFVMYPKDNGITNEIGHLNYCYNDKLYVMESFTTEWLEARKQEIFTACG